MEPHYPDFPERDGLTYDWSSGFTNEPESRGYAEVFRLTAEGDQGETVATFYDNEHPDYEYLAEAESLRLNFGEDV